MKKILALTLACLLVLVCCTGCDLLDRLLYPFGEPSAEAEQEDTHRTPEDTTVDTTSPTDTETTEAVTETTEAEPSETTSEPPRPTVDTDPLLLSALEDEIPIIPEGGYAVYLSEYLESLERTAADSYAFVDFDRDGEKELVIQTDSPVYSYLLLHYSDGDIFAFSFGFREMNSLKTDGSFAGSNGAASTMYFTLRFNGGGYVLNCEASGDSSANSYRIGKNACTSKEFDTFTRQWHSKTDVVWISLNLPEEEAFSPYLEKISYADQGIYEGPGYHFKYVGIVSAAGTYTIVEEARDSNGNLWGRLKSGVGWVNLTDIRAKGTRPPVITAAYADSALLSTGNYYHYVGDTTEWAVQIVFRPGETLKDVAFFSMVITEALEVGEELYFIPELSPSKPFVAQVGFPGDLTTYGIRFTDSLGADHFYIVYMSGLDGSLVLSPYEY